jgi:glycosyltransferase involved in cell wall biosynthesis
MKRLLIVTEHFPPSNSIGTRRICRILKYLDSSRWKIYVLTLKKKYYLADTYGSDSGQDCIPGVPKVYRTEKYDLFFYLSTVRKAIFNHTTKRQGSASRSLGNNGSGKTTSSSEGKKRSLGKKILRFISNLVEFPDRNITWLPAATVRGLRIIKKENIDVIFSSSPRHSVHLITTILKILSKRKLVLDFRDPWVRSPWRQQQRSRAGYERVRERIIEKLEKWVVEQADQVVSVTTAMKNQFVEHYPYLPESKFKVFYNGYDPDQTRLTYPAGSAEKQKGQRRISFLHTGTLYRRRDPTPIFHAIRNLTAEKLICRDTVTFYFLGEISESLVHVKELANALGIDDIVKFLAPVDYKRSLDYMFKSDVLLLLQPYTNVQIPGKFFDYICYEKPIFAIGEPASEVERLIQDRFGIFANYHNLDMIMDGIIKMVKNPHFNSGKIVSNRQCFDISKAIRDFEIILDS